MNTEEIVKVLEEECIKVINDVIEISYDVDPMTDGIHESLKCAPDLWVKMHPEFFVSWRDDTVDKPQRYTLFVSNGEWFINTKDMLYASRLVSTDVKGLDNLQALYKELVGSVIEHPVSKGTLCNILQTQVNDAGAKLNERCYEFIKYIASVSEHDVVPDINDFTTRFNPKLGIECCTPFGTFTAKRLDSLDDTTVYITLPDDDVLALDTLVATPGTNSGMTAQMIEQIASAFDKYHIVYRDNNAWLKMYSALNLPF